VKDLPTSLKWKPEPDAQAYRYELNAGSEAGPRLDSQTVPNPEMQLRQLKSGTYNVSLRAIDAAGYQGVDAQSRVVVELEQVQITLLTPVDDSIVSTTEPEFSWQVSDHSASSRLDIARDPAFSHLVDQSDWQQGSRLRPKARLEPGPYHWRVASVDEEGRETFSETRTLRVRGNLGEVRILSVNYLDNQVGLFWNSLPNTEGYVLQISDSPSFEQILKEETLGKPNAHLRLSAGKYYYARVKGISTELYQSEFGPIKELFIEDKK
jgi:predicted phage tail protein